MDDSRHAADLVTSLSAAAGGRLVLVTPQGVRGNPSDPPALDSASAQDGRLELSFGRGHVLAVVHDPHAEQPDPATVVVTGRQVVWTAHPFGGGPPTHRTWQPGTVAVTWDPERARSLAPTPGQLAEERP